MAKRAPRPKPNRKSKPRAQVQPIVPPSSTIRARYSFLEDFFSLDWQKIPQRWAYGIYALGLYANYPDYVELAIDALTEGPQDRDVDFCYVDRETGKIFIGQTYLADDWGRTEAPAN